MLRTLLLPNHGCIFLPKNCPSEGQFHQVHSISSDKITNADDVSGDSPKNR